MRNVNPISSKLNKIFIRTISSSILATMGLMGGLVPKISIQPSSISLANQAYAQEFTPEEIANYAKAGSEVEQLRRQAYQEIKSITNEPPGNIVCNQEETRENLDPQVQAIANRFCNQILQIPERNNLSNSRYNELTSYYERQDNFYQQVQSVLLKLQN